MLGLLRAMIPGAAFAQTWPNLVNLWTFDETSAAGGVFADSGPANVPITIVGAWADLSTGSLIRDVAGTSAYTNGAGHATIPANHPAHDLSDLTISFYYQRNSAAAKHVLLAASDALSTGIGDFSIEVLPNGRLRAFHRGQDGELRFFGSPDGITGTDLQVGTAHRIELTLGSLGARIYLDGEPLEHAFILANTNGWNNARIKHLGVFPGGLSPADGAFDGLRIWDQQLNGAQVATLEPTQTITLPGAPQRADELSVPSLAEWLRSDEVTPGTVAKYVSNQNRGNGSGSSPANAQEVQAALNGASAGQSFIAVCQTPGTIEFWDYPNGLTFPSGTSNSKRVTLQARQGDGVVISRAEDFSAARTPNSGTWTQSGLSSDDINKRIWRSVNRMGSAGENSRFEGFWIEFDEPHMLLAYNNLSDLRATYGSADSVTNYGTAGAFMSDGFVYIRMQRPHPSKYAADDKWSAQTYPGHPEAVSNGRIIIPLNENPNSYVIHLFRRTTVQAFKSGQWIKVGAGINSLGFRSLVNSHHVWIDRGTHLLWHSPIISGSGDTRNDYFFNRTRMSSGSKIHAARSEWKFGGWLEGDRDSFLIMNNSNTMSNVHCKDCTIHGFHEIYVGANGGNRIRLRNCTIASILDDGFQASYNTNRVEIGYCFFHNSAYGGMGVGGSEPATSNPSQWFMHHNIVDYRQERCTNWRAQPHPGFVSLNHSPDGLNPYKIYNNLIIWGPDNEEEFGPQLMHCPNQTDNTLTGAANMHEVFNNIIMRVFLEGTKRYDAISSLGGAYSDSAQNRSDFVNGRRWVRYSATKSNELFDYNLYWRPVGMDVNGLLRDYARGKDDTVNSYSTLAAWKTSSEFEHSKNSGRYRGAYSPGFDGNSTESKPTLPSIDNYPNGRYKYRPSATSQVTTATSSSLSGANWWTTPPSWGATYFPWNDGEKTLAPSPWKGALDPNRTTLNVGVENP